MAGIAGETGREQSQMEQIVEETKTKKESAWSIVRRVKIIREVLLGSVPESPETAAKEVDPSGALGCLSANLRGSTEAFNSLFLELERIEKALGV